MRKRCEQLLNEFGYEVIDDKIRRVKDNVILDQKLCLGSTKTLDSIKYLMEDKEIINITRTKIGIKLSPRLEVSNDYPLNLAYGNLKSHYQILYRSLKVHDIYINIDIEKYPDKELIGLIEFNYELRKNNILESSCESVKIKQYPASALLEYENKTISYSDKLCTSLMYLDIINDYLMGIDEYCNNKKLQSVFKSLSKFMVKDIDSIFELRDKNIDKYLDNYKKEKVKLTENHEKRILDLDKKIKVLTAKKTK